MVLALLSPLCLALVYNAGSSGLMVKPQACSLQLPGHSSPGPPHTLQVRMQAPPGGQVLKRLLLQA